MDVVYPVCCGIDVHQARLTACLRRVQEDGQVTKDVQEFDTTYPALLILLDWLIAQHCPVVALESTGVYWKPVYHVLAGSLEVLVGNAQDMQQRPGRKTDKADARWIAELLAHGLIRPSFVPPPAISALRDLTRTRVALVQTRSQAKNRVHKVLEDTNVKVASVVTDLFGVSGRRMLAALIAGERDPQALAGLDKIAARDILAEIGTEMSRFGSAARLASWAGVCPGNNESAGKRRRGKSRKGNRYIRRVLVQCAWAARKTPTYLGRTFRRLEVRLGGKKAAVAVAHKILVIVYHLLAEGTLYDEERYDRLQPRQEAQQRQRAIKVLERLGYHVNLERVA